MKEIKLRILAKDVHNSESFQSIRDCVVATAAKRQFRVKNVTEGVDYLVKGENYFKHEEYSLKEYRKDVKSAKNKSPNTLIRELILIPY